jgi:hypothetical protein
MAKWRIGKKRIASSQQDRQTKLSALSQQGRVKNNLVPEEAPAQNGLIQARSLCNHEI